MSQAGNVSSTSGPVPPFVATSYVTDNGTAIPALNILDVFGIDAITNNDNGIFTQANPNLSNVLDVVLSNRISVTATTSDGGGQTQSVTLLTPTNGTAFTYSGYFTGIDTVSGDAAGGYLIGLGRKAAGVVTVVGDTDAFDDADTSLAAADWDLDDSGANLVAVFVGVAGRTIDWRCTFTYQQVS